VDAASGQDGPRVPPPPARSVMTLTALSPVIGYDRASASTRRAAAEDLTPREAAPASGVNAELDDELTMPERLTGPGAAGAVAGPEYGAGHGGAAGTMAGPDSGAGQPGTDPGGAANGSEPAAQA